MRLKKNVDLSSLTTFRIGGRARYFFVAESIPELSQLLKRIDGPFYLLGNGSNLLIKNGTISRPVIKLSGEFQKIKKKGELLEVGSSTLLSFVVKYCIDNNLSGLEALAGMPASVGGMLSNNASSFGRSIFDFLEEVEVINSKGDVYRSKKDDLSYGYRYSNLKKVVIIKGCFKLSEGGGRLEKDVQAIIKQRLSTQDFSFPSCGSVFKNPDQYYAGKLIDEIGLGGWQKNDIKVSQKHANFILNLGKGLYSDVDFVIKTIKDKVFQKKGVLLEEEVQRWS